MLACCTSETNTTWKSTIFQLKKIFFNSRESNTNSFSLFCYFR